MKNEVLPRSFSESSFGVLSLLTRWFSVAMIIFISEFLIRYGILGITGIIISIVGSFFVFGFVTSRARIKYQEATSLHDIVCLKTTGLTKRMILFYFLLLSVGMIFLQIVGINLVLNGLFNIPLYMSKSIFFIVVVIYILLIGDRERVVIEPIYVIILFSTVIFIPAYFFIQQGIEPVYEGIWLYHPYLLFWRNDDFIIFIPTIFLVFFSILLVDRVSWKQLFSMNIRKAGITMALTGVTLGTLLLASISIMFIALSYESFTSASTVMFKIIYYLNPTFLFILFALFCFVVCLKAIVTECNSLIQSIKNNRHRVEHSNRRRTDKKQRKKVLGMVLFLTGITIFYTPPRMLDALFIYGLFTVSMLTPMFIIIFRKSHVPPQVVWSVGVGFIGGLLASTVFGMLLSIWVSFLIASLFSLVACVKRKTYVR